MIEETTFHMAAMLLDIHVPDAQDLKMKRRVVKSIKDKIRAKYNVSVAELGDLDKWQRVVCGVCMISNDKVYLDQAFQSILAQVQRVPGAQLIDHKIEFL